jgi:UDP-glucose 4-epimerase
MRYVVLRYFNVAGSDPAGRIGQSTRKATLLVKVACEASVGKREHVSVFGTDYPTPDGTGVRDYIHVQDLAEGHVAALQALLEKGKSFTVNLGTGRGNSVLEVVSAFEQASGQAIPYEIAPRRAGDVAQCYAGTALATDLLGWRAKHSLADMCSDVWRWQSGNPDGYK